MRRAVFSIMFSSLQCSLQLSALHWEWERKSESKQWRIMLGTAAPLLRNFTICSIRPSLSVLGKARNCSRDALFRFCSVAFAQITQHWQLKKKKIPRSDIWQHLLCSEYLGVQFYGKKLHIMLSSSASWELHCRPLSTLKLVLISIILSYLITVKFVCVIQR